MEIVLTVLFLVFLEGVLSLDNAVVLAVLVKDLPESHRKKALVYGIWGAIGFRLLALLCLTYLLRFTWIKVVAGAYLVWMAFKYFFVKDDPEAVEEVHDSFWKVVFKVELMDIAFSIDSIMAAVAVSDKLWVVFLGGMLGIFMMRMAAGLFVTLLKKWPWLENGAYLLIAGVGGKLCWQAFH